MGFRSVREYAEAAYRDGKRWEGTWRRTAPALSTTMWADMSYGGGGPAANYYASAPGTWVNMVATEGILHGPDVAPATKHLKSACIVPSASTGVTTLQLLDYISYCPFFDGDLDSEQAATSPALTRYTDGQGVKLMLVSQGGGTAVGQFTVRYVNHLDEERTTTPAMNYGVFTNAAGLTLCGQDGGGANYAPGPFVNVYPGDGIKAVKGITLIAACGGVFAAVLVRPIVTIGNKDNTVRPYEVDYVTQRLSMPVIPDGAYLNFLGKGTTAAAPGHIAQLEFIWS
jgi:hypothetical protein